MPAFWGYFRTMGVGLGLFEPVILWGSTTYAILQGGDNSVHMDVRSLDKDLGPLV